MNQNLNERWQILLVDDDEDDFILTRHLLVKARGKDVNVDWIDNYDDARAEIARNRHDVYILDYRLGIHSGLELLREVIADGCKAPIILLTGQGDHKVDLEAMRAGAVDYLIKDDIDAYSIERSIRYAIQRKRVEAELSEMQQQLADSREEERLHLAQELHDGPLQELIGALFRLGAMQVNDVAEPVDEQLQTLQGELQAVIHTLRAICGELRPPALAPFGLERAIRAHAQNFQERYSHLHIKLDLDADEQQLPQRTRLALFRIYQHALANVANHAGASFVTIQLRLTDEIVKLEVVDDGRGFTVPGHWLEIAREGHFGLLGSAERAEAIGGHLRVRSSPGLGTTLSVIAPRPTAVTA